MLLYIISGLPGSGKSYLAKALLAEDNTNTVLIQSDFERKVLFPHPTYTPDEHKQVFAYIHKYIDKCLELGYNVIYDATNRKRFERKVPRDIADRHGAKVCVILVETDPAIVKSRLTNRKLDENMSDAGLDIYEKMSKSEFQPPVEGSWLKLNGADPVESNIREVKSFVEEVINATTNERSILSDESVRE